jgi:hypothetical protein
VLGEPDASLFVVPADYVETKPSDAMMRAILAVGLPLREAERHDSSKKAPRRISRMCARRARRSRLQPADHPIDVNVLAS